VNWVKADGAGWIPQRLIEWETHPWLVAFVEGMVIVDLIRE